MRRWLVIAVAIAAIAALPLITTETPTVVHGAGPNATPVANNNGASGPQQGPNKQPPGPTTAADESFRKDLKDYLSGLQDAVNSVEKNPHTNHHLVQTAHDPAAALNVAQQTASQLNSQQLRALEGMLGQNPAWKQQPAKLKQRVDQVGDAPPGQKRHSQALPGNLDPGQQLTSSPLPEYTVPATLTTLFASLDGGSYSGAAHAVENAMAAGTPTVTFPVPFIASDCLNPGNAQLLFYGYWAAADVAAIANAVASGAPDGADFAPLTIIAGVAFGVANGIAIELQSELTSATDCITYAFNYSLVGTYPNSVGEGTTSQYGALPPGTYLAASSQASVNALKALTGGIQAILDVVKADTNLITQNLGALIGSLGTAQGTATQMQNTLKNQLQPEIDTAIATVGDPPTVQNDTTSNGLANDINSHEDTLLANIATFQALSVQMEIERNLAVSSAPPIALFALPKAQGGYLETVQSIVANTIAHLTAANQNVGNAQQFQSKANQELAAGQFETAYEDYAKAYMMAVK